MANSIDTMQHVPGPSDLACLDFFSASGKIAAAFRKRGWRGVSYDIATGGLNEDLTSKQGFETLLLKALRLLPLALIFAGPPCSLFIFLSSSQHMRSICRPLGNAFDRMTQMANRIVQNAVT